MLSILQRMYDLTPNNPVTITEPVTVVCSNINDVLPIGGEYLRHAVIVLQDADITVKNAAGNTIMRGTDYFTIARAVDSAYSKQYSTSIYSGIKFKTTGTYTVTSFISVGTYPRAGWYNYLFEQFLTLRDVTVAALSAAVSTLRSDLNNMISTVQSTASGLSSLTSEYSNHAADTDIHITAAERAAWNNKTNTYFVATIAERDALTGLKTGDRVVVWDDGDSKRAVYFYAGTSTWYKDSDPDWENISLSWSALSGIPANVAAVVSAAGVTATATAGAVALWDMSGKLNSTTPIDTDANQTVATIEYVKTKVAAAGGGNVSTSDTSSTDGEIVVKDGTTGKLEKGSGKKIGNASGNISPNNGIKCANLYAEKSGFIQEGAYTGADVLAYCQQVAAAMKYGQTEFYVGYNASGINLPSADVDSWTYRLVTALDGAAIHLEARKNNINTDLARWENKYSTESGWKGWVQKTDAKGDAMFSRSTRLRRYDSGDFKTIVLSDTAAEGCEFLFSGTVTNLPGAGNWHVKQMSWSSDLPNFIKRFTAKCIGGGDLREYEIAYNQGNWFAWVQKTDASGNAMNAVHQKAPNYLFGTYTFLQIGAALKAVFGSSGTWDVGINGGIAPAASHIGLIPSAYFDGTNVYLRTVNFAGSSTVNCTTDAGTFSVSISF